MASNKVTGTIKGRVLPRRATEKEEKEIRAHNVPVFDRTDTPGQDFISRSVEKHIGVNKSDAKKSQEVQNNSMNRRQYDEGYNAYTGGPRDIELPAEIGRFSTHRKK